MYGDQALSLEGPALNAFEFYQPAKASPALIWFDLLDIRFILSASGDGGRL